jgi:hypothetical protein
MGKYKIIYELLQKRRVKKRSEIIGYYKRVLNKKTGGLELAKYDS